MSYDFDYGYAALGGAVVLIASLISLAVSVLYLVGLWKTFSKAGEPGWASIVPIFNMYELFKITWGSGWKFLLMLIPIANIVFAIMTMVKLAKVFGKGGGFAAGLIFLGPIFIMILGLGDAQYIGVAAAGGYQQPNYQQPNYQQPNYQQPNYQQPNYQQPNYQQPNYQQPNYGYQPPEGYTPPQGYTPPAGYQQPQQPQQPDSAAFCPSCGSPLAPGAKFCPKCGGRL